MIKHHDSSSHESAASPGDCWKTGTDCKALLVELDDGDRFVLPYRHFVCGLLQPSDDLDELGLLFAAQTVIMKGRGLRTLLLAFQKESVEWVRAIPERYEAARDSEQAVKGHEHQFLDPYTSAREYLAG